MAVRRFVSSVGYCFINCTVLLTESMSFMNNSNSRPTYLACENVRKCSNVKNRPLII